MEEATYITQWEADISKYTNSDGKIEIPNIASYDTGAESKTSDPVKVTPPMDKGAQPKDNTTPPVKADPLPETAEVQASHIIIMRTMEPMLPEKTQIR